MAVFVPKIALIGSGQIGGVIAQLCAYRRLGNVVLFDINNGVAKGKALDIAEAGRIDGFDVSLMGTNDVKDIAGADVVIVSAGLPRRAGMSRDDLLTTNAKIIQTVGENIKTYAPDSIVIVVSNPLDAMVTLMQKVTGFPAHRVMGQAGVLDSSRFATFISWELDISAKDINAPVLGGHGDTMIPLKRYANVNGIPVMELLERKYKNTDKADEVMDAIVRRTREAGGEIVEHFKDSSAYYSPAVSTVQMLETILRDEKRIISVCARLNGEFGVSGYYVGVMAIVGKGGVERIIEMSLNDEEQEMFHNSVNSVTNLVNIMTNLGF